MSDMWTRDAFTAAKMNIVLTIYGEYSSKGMEVISVKVRSRRHHRYRFQTCDERALRHPAM